jgi:hypothetical protein
MLIYRYSDVQTHQLEGEVVVVFNELVFAPIVEAVVVLT